LFSLSNLSAGFSPAIRKDPQHTSSRRPAVSPSRFLVDDGGADADESAGGARTLTPKPGMMILFPSWLSHAVTPYRGTRPRISVAFNFSYGTASGAMAKER